MCWNHPEWLIIRVDACSTLHLLLKGSGCLETFSHAGIHLSDFALWLLILDIDCIFKRIQHSFHIYSCDFLKLNFKILGVYGLSVFEEL